MNSTVPSQTVMGAETEYGFSLIKTGAGAVDSSIASRRLIEIALRRLPHLPDSNGIGLFLSNGSRVYLDCGHVELATPEVTSPLDLVRYQAAGDQILAGLAAELGQQIEADPVLFKCCVDYDCGSTFGAHESYGFRGNRSSLPQQILPFLASRLVIAGQGGFSNLSPGLEFTLSPRSVHLVHDISEDSTSSRGLFNTRDESLCGEPGYHRIHLLHGENLCSRSGSFMRFGTTALVLKMAEAGVKPTNGVAMVSPLAALHLFASDPTLKAAAPLADGRQATALDVQRHYVGMAKDRLGEPWMPAWAEPVVSAWERVLDRLEESPETMTRCLDWKIKHCLYTRHIQRRGFTMEEVESFNGRLANGGAKRSAAKFLALRAELLEIDVRYSQLGARGVFEQLQQAGALEDDLLLPGSCSVGDAIENPPQGTRAYPRGVAVRELAGNSRQYRCDWDGIWDRQTGRHLDLCQPCRTDVQWTEGRPSACREGLAEFDELDVADNVRAFLMRGRLAERRAE